jgi:hypothetical protein
LFDVFVAVLHNSYLKKTKNLFRQARLRHAHTKETKIFDFLRGTTPFDGLRRPLASLKKDFSITGEPVRLYWAGIALCLLFLRRLGDELYSAASYRLAPTADSLKATFRGFFPVIAFSMDKYNNIYILTITLSFVNDMKEEIFSFFCKFKFCTPSRSNRLPCPTEFP